MLRVSGLFVATVAELTPLFSDSTFPGYELTTLGALHDLLQRELQDLDDPYPSGSKTHSSDGCHTGGDTPRSWHDGTVENDYARTLCKEFFWDNEFTPLGNQTITYSSARRAIFHSKTGSIDTLHEYVDKQFQSEANNACRGRLSCAPQMATLVLLRVLQILETRYVLSWAVEGSSYCAVSMETNT
jgi:hypothetical protein